MADRDHDEDQESKRRRARIRGTCESGNDISALRSTEDRISGRDGVNFEIHTTESKTGA